MIHRYVHYIISSNPFCIYIYIYILLSTVNCYQVTPLNLWTVRWLRYLSVFFLVITFLWWVLLLVSIFVSPPGMHSRGPGFFGFSYTTLALGNLLAALLFFSTPTKAQQVSC